MGGYVKPATISDIVHLAFNCREADKQECLDHTGQVPLLAIYGAFVNTKESYTGFYNDQLVCCYGLIESGCIWMCATNYIESVPMTFLKHSKLKLKELFNNYDMIWNYVDARNVVHIKWLKWLGFTIINKHNQFGIGRIPFYEFVKIRE